MLATVHRMHVFLFMALSWAAVLRGPNAAGVCPALPARRQYKYDKHSVESNIQFGERAVAFMSSTHGAEKAAQILANVLQRAKGSQPCPVDDVVILDGPNGAACDPTSDIESGCGYGAFVPYGFWRRFIEDELNVQFTARKKMQMVRALNFYLLRKDKGACTMTALRGMRHRYSCRSNGGALNSQKAAGLGFALLQYFVDHVQRLMSRTDSCMLMTKVRELRLDLLNKKWPEKDLPNLEGGAGRGWFCRWRKHYGIVKKTTGMKLKVSWSKLKRRIRVFLGNIFRLRAFWEICHPGVEMRFLSLDQKPSWFNNAGHTGTFGKKGGSQPNVREIYAHTRQRYSILTSVQSWDNTDQDNPPKIAILFKATPGGTVLKNLSNCDRLKPWMKVQVQENGSYRSVDMVEALDWMLPTVSKSEESIIVILDWYSGHLTAEVDALVMMDMDQDF